MLCAVYVNDVADCRQTETGEYDTRGVYLITSTLSGSTGSRAPLAALRQTERETYVVVSKLHYWVRMWIRIRNLFTLHSSAFLLCIFDSIKPEAAQLYYIYIYICLTLQLSISTVDWHLHPPSKPSQAKGQQGPGTNIYSTLSWGRNLFWNSSIKLSKFSTRLS